MCDENFLEQVAYVLASKHRTNIILFMGNELYTPTQIGKEIDLRPNHVSNLLKQLKGFDLVYCATPNIKKGKFYSLTGNGKKVLQYIKEKQQE